MLQLLTTTDPLNRTTTLTYDLAGNVAKSTDTLNRVTTFQHDQKNRLKQVTDPTTGVTTYTYDATHLRCESPQHWSIFCVQLENDWMGTIPREGSLSRRQFF